MNDTNECTITCEEGYGFATEESNAGIVENILLLKCNGNTSNWLQENYIPDCTGMWFDRYNLYNKYIINQGEKLQY